MAKIKDLVVIRNYALFLTEAFLFLFVGYIVWFIFSGNLGPLFSSFFFLFFACFSFYIYRTAKRLLFE